MDLRRIRNRIDDLLAAHEDEVRPPTCVVLLPENHRDNYTGPWPYVRRMGACAMIVYRIEDGQPDAETVRRLVAEVTP